MKIAIVHDWLVNVAGAEKVLKQLLICYPNADVFCLFDYLNTNDKQTVLNGRKTTTTYLQNIPFIKTKYRFLIPFLFKAIEKLDLKDYDLIISSSHAVAKGVKKHKHQQHFCYCHTPVRYAWNLKSTYLKRIPPLFKSIASNQLEKMRVWDLENSQQIDFFIANSNYIKGRIKSNYQREADVIHPPVDADYYQPKSVERDNNIAPFLVISRLVHYKMINLIIEAFNQLPHLKLQVIGEGPQLNNLKAIANKNITFLGFLPNSQLINYYQNSEALIQIAVEDFGITSLEAQACGLPVIALNKGGYTETTIHHKTGVLFEEQTANSLIKGIEEYLKIKSTLKTTDLRANAILFGEERFRSELMAFINNKIIIKD